MENFITVDMFTTLIGCILIVTAGVEVLKKYININPLILNLFMSLIVTIIRIFAVGDFSGMGITLGLLNIIPILLGATGGYEVLKNIATKIKGTK